MPIGLISVTRFKKVKVPLGDEGVINLIRGSTDGIYIASAGPESYLFHKSYEDSVFRNISVPLNINPIGDFNVTDLKFIENEIWLATSNGLMRFDHQTLHHISLGNNFTKLPIKSIQLHPENKLLVANAFGLILLNLENLQFDFFNESSGLLSNTITFRGLFVGNNKTIWVGTAKGLCYSTTSLTELKNTPTPKFTQVFANGGKVSLGNDSEIPYGSFLSVQVSCITFPNEVTLQYRLLPDSIWNFSTASTLTFSGLAAGNYTLEVKAKKNGPFTWSEPALLGMTIGSPFWHRWWFYLLCLVSGGIVIAITIFGVNTINKRRNLVLQKLVDERTNELRISNEELLNLNHEKNNLIGIVAHDLKNPLAQILSLISLIKVTTTLNEETSHNLELMKQTAERLNILILKILDVDAIESKQMNLNLEPANLSAIVEELTNRFAQEATNKNLTISKQIPADLYALADKNYYEQVLENLLSNAIKFSPQNLKVFVSLHLSGNQVVLEIKDEGPGLSAQDQQKLFGKYQKLSARPTGGETSTGLGLSITKKFVEAMGGKIWCESELNKGASFFVALRQPNELPG